MKSRSLRLYLTILCCSMCSATPTNSTREVFTIFRDFYQSSCGPDWRGTYLDCGFRSSSQCWNISVVSDPCNWFGIRCRDGLVVAVLLEGFGLCGAFPAPFHAIPLVSLDLSDNPSLSGELPPLFASLFPTLSQLNLRNTSIGGSLQPLSNSTSLSIVNVGATGVTALPDPFPASVTRFFASTANIVGCLPKFPSGSALESFQVAHNLLDCGVGNLESLALGTLDLSDNLFNSTLPSNWTNICSALQILDLSQNQFRGDLPDISACAILRFASFGGNNLTGSLQVLGDLLHRKPGVPLTISFQNNRFSGRFPWEDLVPQSSPILANLDISGNTELTGSITNFVAANIRGFELLPLLIDARFTQVTQSPECDLCEAILTKVPSHTDFYPGYACDAVSSFDSFRSSTVVLRLPPAFFNFTNCACLPGLCGEPPLCSEPPKGASCPSGGVMQFGAHLYPVYSSAALQLPDAFETCPMKADGSSSCTGGRVRVGERRPPGEFCEDGSERRMCTECKEGFFREAHTCRRCETPSLALSIVFGAGGALLLGIFLVPTKRANWFLLIAELSVTVVLVFIGGLGDSYIINILVMVVIFQLLELLHLASTAHGSGAAAHGLPVIGDHRVTVSGILKVALYYFQFTSMLNDDVWPQSLRPLLNAINSGALVASGPECSPWFKGLLDEELGSLVKAALLPPMLLSVVVLMLLGKAALMAIRERCRGATQEHTEQRLLFSDDDPSGAVEPHVVPTTAQQIASVAAFVIFAVYMEISVTILEVFKCDLGADGVFYLVKKPFFACVGPEYDILHTVAISLFVLFVVGVPIVFAALLFKFRKRLFDSEVEYILGFLYESYKPEYAWWEMVQFARRFILIMLYSFFPSQSSTVECFLILILLVSAVVTIEMKPYAFPLEAFLDISATLIILVTHAIRSIVKLEQLLIEQVATQGTAGPSLPGIWIATSLNIAFIAALLFVWTVSGLRVIISALKKRYLNRRNKNSRTLELNPPAAAQEQEY